jgi:hypothetical protein
MTEEQLEITEEDSRYVIIIIIIIILLQCYGIKQYTQTEKLQQIGQI